MGDLAKHTPGPWAVAARKGQIATQGPATEWLATMPHSASDGFGLTDVGEIAANARLIAAAPDLLANAYAADTCLSVVWGYARELGKHEEANHILEVQQSVRAALAAATGANHEQ